MKKISVVFISAALLSGCYECPENSSQQFKWATVDKRVLEEAIFTRAKTQNPFVSASGMNRDEISEKNRKLYRQMSDLEKDAREKCIAAQNKAAKEQKPEITREYNGATPPAPRMAPRSINSTRYSVIRACDKKIKSDPLIVDLRQRKEKLDNYYKEFRDHEKQVRKHSEQYAKQLIEQHAKSKYEIVVSGRKDYILFNSTGLTLDITDAVIAGIDNKMLKLPGESPPNKN